MAAKRVKVPLGEVCDVRQGRYLAPGDMSDVRTDLTPIPVIGANGVLGYTDQVSYHDPVTLVTCRGSNCGILQRTDGPTWISNNAMACPPKKPHDSRYIHYVLQATNFSEVVTGSAQPQITARHLNTKLLAITRDPDEQKAIAVVLGRLDDKITLNNRINAELEGMAKLLYDYWFVQFDFPMTAAQAAALGNPQLAGKPYRASGGKMIYNETLKREIPQGWEVGSLPDIATFTNGIACQKYPAEGGPTLRVIKIKEMRDGFTADSDVVTAQVPEKVKIKNGDILFSWSASLEVMIWKGGEGALNQHIFKVTSDTHPRSFCYFVLLDYLRHFQMIADLRKTTMGHITLDHLEQSCITLPDAAIVDQFETATKPLIERMIKAYEETQELTTLRDWLLPMLMNGQVTVN